ncbi:MAG: MBL fold metallo-hydrolase, partial [Bacilli bacterium]|nr:MBL fold metallo-hydrolase [Bacilli bacterium]
GGNDAYDEPIKETPGPSAVPLPGSEEEKNEEGTNEEATSDNSDLPSEPDGTISGDLEVHFINPNSRVDAIYVKVGDKSMFIDGGFKYDATKEIAYMQKIGVKTIDYYIGTHSHKDHVEAAPPIIQKYGIKKVIVGRETCNGSSGTACTWYTIQYFAKEQNINLNGASANILKPGDTFYLGNAKISCIGPISVNNSLGRGDGGQNYNSLIFRLDYGSKSFLFTGDGSSSNGYKAIEQAYPGKLRVNVLKNAHHNGDNGNSSYSLIKAEYVVFLTKDGDLPSQSCTNTIKNNGCKQYFIVTNSRDGNVVFSSDGTNLNIRKNHNP